MSKVVCGIAMSVDGYVAGPNQRADAPLGDGVGGAATVIQYLAAGLIDELHLHIAPVVLGRGERLFEGVDRTELRPRGARHTDLVTHVRYAARRASR